MDTTHSRQGKRERMTAHDEKTKACPCCKALLFADMDVCYSCLFDFSRTPQAISGFPDLDEPFEEAQQTAILTHAEWQKEAEEAYGFENIDPVAKRLSVATPSLSFDAPVPESGLLVGSSDACDITLRSLAIGKKQLRVFVSSTGLKAEAFESASPTLLNGEPLVGSTSLVLGDTLELFGEQLTVLPEH